MIEALGFKDVKTLLQSGNVVFRGAAKAPAKLESQLEAALEKRLGIEGRLPRAHRGGVGRDRQGQPV